MSEQYQTFLLKLNRNQAKHFDPDHPPTFDAQGITLYLKPGTPPPVAAHLSARLATKVEAAIKAAWGDDAPDRFFLTESGREKPVTPPGRSGGPESTLQNNNDLGEDEDDYQGIYHNPENTIIQPEKSEWGATQYYRKKWRPLLGPTLSELVRELRQRCHFKSKRNNFKTTYKNLANALGVSEITIKRALARDRNGQFKNEYLHYFIADIQTIRETNEEGKIRTKGTRFLIYLDDTLTPDDTEVSK